MIPLARAIQRLMRRLSAQQAAKPASPLVAGLPTVYIPPTSILLAQRLADPSFIKTTMYRRYQLRADPVGSDPRLKEFAQKFLKELKARDMPFYAHCYIRGKEQQNNLRKAGVSKAGWPNSPHNRGAAVDIVHCQRQWDLTKKEWAVIGLIGKEVARKANLKVVWGGDWKFYDPAHWELADWRELEPVA